MPDSRLLKALLVVAALAAPGQARAQVPDEGVIDRVIAVVRIRTGAERGDLPGRSPGQRAAEDTLPADVITASGLEFEARVAMISRGAIAAAEAPLDPQTLQSALDNAIWERLLAGEADLLQAFRVEPQEVEAALRAFRSKFPSDAEFTAFLQRNEVDVQTLARTLERSVRAGKVLDSKVRLRAQVSESDVRRYYEANQAQLGQPYDELRSALREKLFRERYRSLVQKELSQLERAHDVRRVAPMAQERRRAEG